MNIIDKRQAKRHQGFLPVEVGDDKCSIRDFSTSGVFFETDKSFISGQEIEFTIMLEHVAPGHPIRLKCQGEIVRVEEKGQKIGVAATINSYTFENLDYSETLGKGGEGREGLRI